MEILLIKPKALYVLNRFADACSRQGNNLSILLASKTPDKHYVLSYIDDTFETVKEIACAGEDVEKIAGLLGTYDAIVAGGEYSVIFGERLSARMGLFHNDLSQVEAYRNKYLMRQSFAQADVPQPKLLARFSNMTEVDQYEWSNVSFPVIVKPVDMSSSLYVRLCHDVDSARRIYRRMFKHSQSFSGVSFNAQGLLEEVAQGQEFSLECVVQNRELRLIFLTTKFLSPYPACDEIGHLSGAGFTDEAMEQQARMAVEGIVRAWNIESAVLHAEFKYADGRLNIIEAACRVAGDLISVLVEKRYGVSLEECLVLLRCKLDVQRALVRYRPTNASHYYGICYLFSENLNTPPPSEIEILETVRNSKSDSGPGGGLGLESRLGHHMLRSSSLSALTKYLGALSTA